MGPEGMTKTISKICLRVPCAPTEMRYLAICHWLEAKKHWPKWLCTERHTVTMSLAGVGPFRFFSTFAQNHKNSEIHTVTNSRTEKWRKFPLYESRSWRRSQGQVEPPSTPTHMVWPTGREVESRLKKKNVPTPGFGAIQPIPNFSIIWHKGFLSYW